ncbi:hypothetical protein RJ639_023404 [Escallonia herrerae]|uniref:Reverse transcriptase Ty1/copia-type domain-containing protein n=1 Tax=Escallonia herrerae TaxID=1293975 RepID=A0AA88UZR7_9ASTE|nr:hypothetical protein RJ639_023404 [Escallonia herrerae]
MAPNTSTKYNLEKFDGSNDFSLWRMKMRAVLIQQGLLKALKWKQGLSDMMSADEKEDMLERAHSALLCKWGNRLWCPDSESSKKRELIDAGKDHGAREKVELEFRALDSLPIIPTDKEDGSHSTEENEEPQEQQYNREEKFDLLRIKHTSIRVLLAMVALYDLQLEQLDVKIAFLHAELEEQIFMCQPEGFMIQGKEDHVCLLKKSLYGLKQSPRQWYKRFDTFMVERGYTRSAYDSRAYHQRLTDGSHRYLLLVMEPLELEIMCSELTFIRFVMHGMVAAMVEAVDDDDDDAYSTGTN